MYRFAWKISKHFLAGSTLGMAHPPLTFSSAPPRLTWAFGPSISPSFAPLKILQGKGKKVKVIV